MYAPASAIRKSQMQKFVRQRASVRVGSEASPWTKDTEYHLGGMTNTYTTGPKKGQETGTFSLLINPSAGQNKLMPQIIEPFVFGEKALFNQQLKWFVVRAKTPEAAIYLRDDVKHLADTAYVEQPSFGELLLNLSRNRPVITIRLIDLTLTMTGATFMLKSEIRDITGARFDPDEKSYYVMLADEAEAITMMSKLEEMCTFWGVVLNPIAPLALPKPQNFMYPIPQDVPIAAAAEASSSAADANAGNTSASDAAAGPA